MVVLATAATIIASQATITGAFSVTRQCIQLDLLPRLRITQTSAHEHCQIYVPVVNWFVLVAVCMFVLSIQNLGCARRRLRRGSRRHHVHHHAARHAARSLTVALAPMAGRGRCSVH